MIDSNPEGRTRRASRFLPAALALMMMAGANPPVPEARPIMTSLGITREDGMPVGVIGGHERFRLQAPPGKTFREVVWEIEGTIAKQEISRDRGFVNTPLPNPLVVRLPPGSTESIVEFNWDAVAGKHSIGVTAYYTDGTSGMPAGFSRPIED